MKTGLFVRILLASGIALVATSATAQTTETFFRGKQITLIIGYNPGGSYDVYSTLAANALSRFIPGNPTVVPKYMPGVGGLKAANFIYSQGSRDGLTLGMVSQAAALRQTIGEAGIEYDARGFNWIGRLASAVELTLVSKASGVRTLADAKAREVVLGGTSAGSTTDVLPRLMNQFAGTRFKVVKGYPGTTGASLAMERGEVDGANETVDTLLFSKPRWLAEKLVSVLVQYSLKRHRAIPDAPAMVEVAENAEDRRLLAMFGGTAEMGRSLVAPPGLPADRVNALRRAFDAMAADKAFRDEVARRNLDLDPLTGEDLEKLVAETLDVPRGVASRAAAAAAP